MRLHWIFALLAATGMACGSSVKARAEEGTNAPTGPATPGDALQSLSVREGFVIERVAGPPLVERPIFASFDDRGRLFVADSAGVNLPGAELAKNPPHRIMCLEDVDGDGTFDTSHVFADKLVFPQGLLWHDGAVFVASPPCLWRLDDTDGDGVCDRRTALISGFPLTGVSDDMHGACLGPDGFVYTCSGRFPHHLIDVNGKPIEAGGSQPVLVRCRPDGSAAEIVCGTHGNGVETAWTDEGDAFLSGTFYGGPGLRDALIHAVEGGDYPVLDQPMSTHQMKSTGELLPAMVQMPATAPAGLLRYRGGAMGQAYENNLFCAYFNRHAVHRHVLERDGATFRATDEPFLTSTSSDFHPTDVLEDDSGALLVVDTGGWFRIGCPTSQIAKPDVKGGIYRVFPKDRPRGVTHARGLDWEHMPAGEAADRLGTGTWIEQERGIGRLAKLGASAVPVLRNEVTSKGGALNARRNAVWALTRIDGAAAREATRVALGDASASVRQVAAYSAGLHRDAGAAGKLTQLLADDDLPVRREAATALGRIGNTEAAPALLAALKGGASDRFLEHAIVYALIRIGDPEVTTSALGDDDPAVRRGALLALDPMDDGRLTAERVIPLLGPAQPALHKAALRVLSRHPQWAAAMVGYFQENLPAAGDWPASRRDELRQQLIAFAADPAVRKLIADTLAGEQTAANVKLLLLETIAEAPTEGGAPEPWAGALRQCLDDRDARVVRQAVLSIRAAPALLGAPTIAPAPSGKSPAPTPDADADAVDPALLRIARDANRPADLRVDALLAAAPRLVALEPALFDLLISSLDKSAPALLRAAAADAVGRMKLDSDQLTRLAAQLPAAGPLELPKLLAAFGGNVKNGDGDVNVGAALVAALDRSRGIKGLRPEALRDVLAHYPADVQESAGPLLARLSATVAEQKARLDAIEHTLVGGDAGRGRALFFGTRAVCATCHTVRGEGGRVGPDLSAIGALRGRRDLLEAVVFPSASFARTFEPYMLKTRSGAVEAGVIQRETADAIYLTTGPGSEKRFARSDIADLRRSPVSVMPEGLDAQLTPPELADLIAFLRSLK